MTGDGGFHLQDRAAAETWQVGVRMGQWQPLR
jgi:hypothetical protein